MKRVLTALLLLPGVIWAILWSPRYLLIGIVAAVALLCWREYNGIVAAYGIHGIGPVGWAGGLLILVIPAADVALVTVLALILLAMTLRSGDLSGGLSQAAAGLLGLAYIFGAWRTAISIHAISPYWLLFAMTINWVGDTAAYYTGRLAGRHKLAPRISPAKSWEGSTASLAASLAFAAVYLGQWMPLVPAAEGLAIAAAGNVAGQIGDLCESALKRGAGLKDSGSMLPGHGGWLDRLDSSLFSVPVVYLLVARPWHG